MKVLLCLGRLIPAGPIGPWRCETGAPVDGRRSRGVAAFDIVALVYPLEEKMLRIDLKLGTVETKMKPAAGVLSPCYLILDNQQ